MGRALRQGRLEDKVALVTGAASGIGAATALRFAREGARVAGFDLKPPEPGAWAETELASPGVLFQTGDVSEEKAVAAAVEAVLDRFGRLDILMNAAGIAGGGWVHTLAEEAWDRVLAVNLKGTFLCCKHALGPMLEQDSGSIVNVASIEGLHGVDGGSAYNASKGGVVLLTRNLSIDYGRRGIRVNCLCPGLIDTPMTAGLFQGAEMAEFRDRFIAAHHLGRMGRPEEIASAALFLASEDASFVTGQALAVDGGVCAGQSYGFRRLAGLE